MTRWRVVKAPASRHGPRYAVLSDREPGPILGARGGLHGWGEVAPDGIWCSNFEAVCDAAATLNGKPSTANMGPREAAEGGG